MQQKYGTVQCHRIVFDAYDNEYTVAITQSNQEFLNCPIKLEWGLSEV